MFLSLLFATAFAGTDITLSTSDGVKVHAVHEEAKGATRGTILVHMAGRSATDWSYVAQRLSKGGHHVVAPDLRGHGKNASDDPDAEIPPEDYPLMIHEVEAAADFLRSHGVTEVSCAGASIGANLCLQAAAKDDAIVNLVLLSPGCLLYTSPSPRDQRGSRMPSSA